MIKRSIKKLISRFGYEIRKSDTMCFNGFNSSYLTQICKPRTVIDVGVGYGTPALYEAFPDAYFILFEPLREYASSIKKLAGIYDCEVHFKAVADIEGELDIFIDTADFQHSSLSERSSLTHSGNSLSRRTIEVTTLDSVLRKTPHMKSPLLLKIDTEGYELAVLKGAESMLKVVDTVIAEVSISKRFEISYEFFEIVSFLNKNGFYLFSFLSLYHPKGEDRPRYADIVFKRRDSVK